ncbi:hypothetical protein MLD38_024270 [Melastoma candidum]|uniref:Uncharacterized protein n=1 Tax=Melastoma candidum TaxID=119954 RepID=A0ACB9NRI8_9MYRT|nr:hypothetical protein MLD38_024270 [Melastoma candidum]
MTTTAATIALLSPSAGPTTAASPALRRPLPPSSSLLAFPSSRRPRRIVSCEVALTSNDAPSSSSSSRFDASEDSSDGESKVGARVRVKVPLKVYHAQRVGEEVDLQGMEGVIKQFVGVWKGKRISANLPYKVEFFKEVEGRGEVKFVAHLKDDEFEFV